MGVLRMRTRQARWLIALLLVTGLLVSAPIGTAHGALQAAPNASTVQSTKPRFTSAAGFDVSPPMRDVANQAAARRAPGAWTAASAARPPPAAP